MDGKAPGSAPRSVQVGEWRITALSDGFFRLDGGAMWGVVPAKLWRPLTPPDPDNTIRLALRPFLAERGDAKVLIEPGIGDRWDAKSRAIYKLERETTLERSLAAGGVGPEDVTHVVLSHCHWDHCAAAVVEREGELVPLFPRARHFAPRTEIERAKRPGHARAASYRADDVLPLEQAGLLEPFDDRAELVPGVVAHVLGGHSDGVSVVTIGVDEADRDAGGAGPGAVPLGDGAIFWSDVVPTTHHVQPPYIMAYDLDVARSYEVRSEWIRRAAARGWIGLFFHDESIPFARLARDGKRFAAIPAN